MDRLQNSQWRKPRFLTVLTSRATSSDPAALDSIERVVRLIIPPARVGESEIETKLISLLKTEGAVSSRLLVQRIARDLYDEELKRGAAAVDIGIFGSRLFEPEVAHSLSAGKGTLWEIV